MMSLSKLLSIGFAVVLVMAASTAVIAAPKAPSTVELRYAQSESTPTPTPVLVTSSNPVSSTTTMTGSVRIATSIADYFGVGVEDVDALRTEGMGWGEIVKAYSIAALTGDPVSAILDLRNGGEGWGEIALSKVKWNVNLGQIIRNAKPNQGEETETEGGSLTSPNNGGPGRGAANGKGHGKGKGK